MGFTVYGLGFTDLGEALLGMSVRIDNTVSVHGRRVHLAAFFLFLSKEKKNESVYVGTRVRGYMNERDVHAVSWNTCCDSALMREEGEQESGSTSEGKAHRVKPSTRKKGVSIGAPAFRSSWPLRSPSSSLPASCPSTERAQTPGQFARARGSLSGSFPPPLPGLRIGPCVWRSRRTRLPTLRRSKSRCLPQPRTATRTCRHDVACARLDRRPLLSPGAHGQLCRAHMDWVSVGKCCKRSGVAQGGTSPATGAHAHALCTWATSISAAMTRISQG